MIQQELHINKKAWDSVAATFFNACSLPTWGPFYELSNKNILGNIKGKTFLEIGCGSGHSIRYLMQNGAARVYGIDISTKQIQIASAINQDFINRDSVRLFEAPMEKRVDIEPVDVVFSIYAIGWTRNPNKLIKNVNAYLKTSGKFIWSWEHPLFSKVIYGNDKLYLHDSYFNEETRFVAKWSKSNGAYIQSRTVSSWFSYLNNNGFIIRDFLEPTIEKSPPSASDNTRYYSEVKAKNIPCTMVFMCEKVR